MDRLMSDRQNKHEDKWALNEQMQFKAVARRNKLLGLWAAAEMGLTGDEANAYAKSVVASDFQEAGEEDVFRKVSGDLRAKGLSLADEVVRQKMAEFTRVAREQIASGS
jgi:hypothetical protein